MTTRVTIVGTGHALPATRLDNDTVEAQTAYDRAARGGSSLDAWARRNHGGRLRHVVAPGEATSDLALVAARRALADAEILADELDLVVLATFTGDHLLPQTAAQLQHALGSRARCLQIDAACSGFLDALGVAEAMIARGHGRRALVVAADILSRLCDPRDFVTRTVFGDAAGAVVLAPCREDEVGIAGLSAGTDGELGEYVLVPAGGSRRPLDEVALADGEHYWRFRFGAIHEWALDRFARASAQALAAAGVAVDEIDLVVPHQASSRLLAEVADRLAVPRERVVDVFPEVGNISGASIPVALDIAREAGRLKAGDWLLMPAVGAGMAWGAAVVRWEAPARQGGSS